MTRRATAASPLVLARGEGRGVTTRAAPALPVGPALVVVVVLALAGCALDTVGGIGLALGDPAGVLDDAESVGVWAVKSYPGIASCADAEAGFADIVMAAPAGSIEAMVTVSPRAGSTELKLDDGIYAIVVEAYRRNAIDPETFDIIGIGCAEVQVTGDGEINIVVRPRV